MSGPASAGLMLFQLIWYFFYVFEALSSGLGAMENNALNGPYGAVFLLWPTGLAFAAACYSLATVGLNSRNKFGAVGFVFSATILLLCVIVSFRH